MPILNIVLMSVLHGGDLGLGGWLIFLLMMGFIIGLPVLLVVIIYKVFSKK